MILALLGGALAAEAPLAAEARGADFVVVDGAGHRVLPDDFAEAVGDDAILAAYQRNYRLVKTVGVAGWAGGPTLAVGGLWVFVLGGFSGQPMLMLGGAGTAAMGVALVGAGTIGYAVGRSRANRMSTWYTLDEADDWIARAGLGQGDEPAPSELLVVFGDRGVTAIRGDEELGAEQFALQVGDMATWRATRFTKWGVTTGGIALCATGYVTTMLALDAADATTGLAFATAGLAMAGTGVLSLTLGRRIYRDMDTWYDLGEARALAEGGVAAARPTAEIHAVVTPLGVGLAGTF